MTEFTKGPWSWIPDKWNGGLAGLVSESGQDVVVPQCRNDGDDGAAWFEEITPADAALIAAAPDLYLALSYCLAAFEELNILPATKRLIIEAQAKARGITA